MQIILSEDEYANLVRRDRVMQAAQRFIELLRASSPKDSWQITITREEFETIAEYFKQDIAVVLSKLK